METINKEPTTSAKGWTGRAMEQMITKKHEKYILFSAQKSEKGIGWKLGRLLGID